jgi:hypothetical protein
MAILLDSVSIYDTACLHVDTPTSYGTTAQSGIYGDNTIGWTENSEALLFGSPPGSRPL